MVPRSAFVVLLSSAYGRARGAQQEPGKADIRYHIRIDIVCMHKVSLCVCVCMCMCVYIYIYIRTYVGRLYR